MKKLLVWIVALMQLSGGALLAQDMTGTWQGTLAVGGRELRIAYKIVKEGNTLKTTMYSIDQGGQGIPVSATTLQGSTFKMAIPGIGGVYEGKLDSDGVNLAGTWSQGGGPGIPLNLKLVKGDAAWAIPEPPRKMPAGASPGVEVATVKPANPETKGRVYGFRGGQFNSINNTLSDLIAFAYGVHARQIDGPAWMESEKYDIVAKPDIEGQPTLDQMKILAQKLLADRFALKFHHAKKELTVYALVVGKTGSKMTKDETDPSGAPSLLFRALGVLPGHNATMAEFADVMQSAVLTRPVVDQTGLPGRYDFSLKWTPDETQFATLGGAPPPSPTATDPDLFTAIQEQMGLKLESTKAPVDVLVIDHVEKPSAN